MLKTFTRIFAIAAIACMAACASYSSPESRAEGLDEAYAAIDAGDNSHAKSIADGILKDANNDNMTASDFGRLSIIFMRLSDCDDVEDNTAVAYQCYRNAYKVNADSAAAFYSSVSRDNAQYVHMLSALQQQIENPNRNNIPDHEDEDTESDNH